MANPSEGPARADSRLRDLVLLGLGVVVGAAAATGTFLLLDDDGPTSDVAGPSGNGSDPTEPTVDPTDTEFGRLTDASRESGVRVQWVAELLDGGSDSVDFVTAHRGETVALTHDGVRVVVDGNSANVCRDGGCAAASVEAARAALAEPVRPYFEVIRAVGATTGDPEYRITGETELDTGIFEQCGAYAPSDFGLALPETVVSVNQCIDVARSIPLRIGLQGEGQQLGGAVFTGLADASAEDFSV